MQEIDVDGRSRYTSI